jgi:hypothetical protein
MSKMDNPHKPTLAELEDLFRLADDNPPTRDEWVRATARAFLYAWDEGLTIPQLQPFVEEVRKALDGRT